MLVDGIGLNFDHVSLALNALDDSDPEWWNLGKLYAYRAQETPFIHIDTDVFLWQRLPERLLAAPVFAQNPEYFIVGLHDSYYNPYYMPEKFEKLLLHDKQGWIPEEWLWCRRTFFDHQKAASCGIFGGTRTDFIRHYAELAIKFLEHQPNKTALSGLKDKSRHVILPEQYLLSACIDYHRHRSDSEFSAIGIEYLFPSVGDFYNASSIGYTHLIAKSKSNASVVSRLEKRVMTDYPKQYLKCLEYISRT